MRCLESFCLVALFLVLSCGKNPEKASVPPPEKSVAPDSTSTSSSPSSATPASATASPEGGPVTGPVDGKPTPKAEPGLSTVKAGCEVRQTHACNGYTFSGSAPELEQIIQGFETACARGSWLEDGCPTAPGGCVVPEGGPVQIVMWLYERSEAEMREFCALGGMQYVAGSR